MERKLAFIRRASQTFLNAKEKTDHPKLTLNDITSQASVIESVYKLNYVEYRSIFPSTFIFEDVVCFLKDNDKFALVSGPDLSSRTLIVSHLRGNYDKFKYCLSFLWTAKNQLNEMELCKIYSDCKDSESICKKFARTNIYQFWLGLDIERQEKLIAWYNAKTPDIAIHHPYYEFTECTNDSDSE